jgi:hypothetical protein
MRATTEVPTAGGKAFMRLLSGVNKSGQSAAKLAAVDAAVAGSKLKERAPDTFLEALEAAGLNEQDLYVPAQDVREYFQSQNLDDTAVERWGIDPALFAEKVAAVAKIGNMGKAERAVYDALTAPSVEEQQQAFVAKVRKEVARRILSCASTATQMNLAAAAAGSILSEDQMTAYRAGLAWVAQIRATGASLVAAGDPDFADDAKWPTIPASAAELAAQF